MPDENYIINIVLRARDEMANVLAKARNEVSNFSDVTDRVNTRMGEFDRSVQKMNRSLNQLTDQARKVREGIRSIGGEDIKIKMELDDSQFNNRIDRTRQNLEKVTKTTEELRIKREKLAKTLSDWDVSRGVQGYSQKKRELEDLDVLITKSEAHVKTFGTQLANAHKDLHLNREVRKQLADVDKDIERTVTKLSRMRPGSQGFAALNRDLDRLKTRFQELGGADIEGRISHFVKRSGGDVRDFSIEVDRAGRSVRRTRGEVSQFGGVLGALERFANKGHESIAKFDNELRGMRVLAIIFQLQALISAVVGLSGQLVAVAGSAIMAGSALGGALAAGAAQAVPVIGLLAGVVARLKSVFDVVGQADQARQAQATQATSAQDQQAQSADKLANATDTLRDSKERIADAERDVADAHREARRELEDLYLAEQRSNLQHEQSIDNLRQLRSSGVTGFELQQAQLDVAQTGVDVRRGRQDANQGRRRGIEGSPRVQAAERSLRDAQQNMERAQRGLDSAERGIAQGAGTTVAAGRTLDYLRQQLSGAERQLVDSLERLRGTYRRIFRPITDEIVTAFRRGVDRANEVMKDKTLVSAFRGLGNEMADQLDRVVDALSDDRTVGFFARMTKEARSNLEPATTAAIHISRAFMNIAEAAAPILHHMFEDFADFSAKIEDATRNQGRLTDIFDTGYTHLKAWLDLGREVAHLIAAIIAPGGDLTKGAAASGLRSVTGATEQIKKATDYVNTHGKEVNQFFIDSERVIKAVGGALLTLGGAMLQLFNPATVETLASIIEELVPAIAIVAHYFNLISEVLEFMLKIPGMEWVVAFLLIQRLGSRFILVIRSFALSFVEIGANIKNAQLNMIRLGETIGTVSTTQGNLTRKIEVGRAAWVRYGLAAAEANALASGTGFGPRGPQAPIGGGRGRTPAVVPTGGGGAGGAARGAGGLLLGAARGAGRFVGPLAAFVAFTEFISTNGTLFERSISAMTLGLVKFKQALPKDVAHDRRAASDQARDLLGGPAPKERFRGDIGSIQKDLDIAISRGDVDKVKDLQHYIHLAAKDAKDYNREDLAKQWRQLGKQAKDAATSASDLGDGFKRMRDGAVVNIRQLREVVKTNFDIISDITDKDTRTDQMQKNMRLGIKNLGKLLEEGAIDTKTFGRDLQRILHTHSKAGADALQNNIHRGIRFLARQMKDGETIASTGMKAIRKLYAEELRMFGFNADEVRYRLAGKEFSGKNVAAEGDVSFVNKATGGPIGQLGERGRDGVRAMVGRGEAILNWGHQKVIEPALNAYYGFGLHDMFRRTKGYHAGGPEQEGFAGGRPNLFDGHPSNVSSGVAGAIEALKKKFPGLMVTSTTDHSKYTTSGNVSDHTLGNAADIASGDYGYMNRAAAWIKQSGMYRQLKQGIHNPNLAVNAGRIVGADYFGPQVWAQHANHIHIAIAGALRKINALAGDGVVKLIPRQKVSGPDSPHRDVLQSALDIQRAAANKRIRQVASLQEDSVDSHPGGDQVPSFKGPWTRVMNRLANQAHWNLGDWKTLIGKESGGNPEATNPSSGAFGLGQFLGATAQAYAKYGALSHDPAKQIYAMYRYISDRYGSPSKALAFHNSHNWYAAGGILGNNVPEGSPINFTGHAGEWILNKSQQTMAAAMAGISRDKLKGALGFSGGPDSYQGGGELAQRAAQREFRGRPYSLPDILPNLPEGFFEEIEQLTVVLGRLPRKAKDFYEKLNKNLNFLTRDGGLLDSAAGAIEARGTRLETNLNRRTFGLRGGVVRRVLNEGRTGAAALDNLEQVGDDFIALNRIIVNRLRGVNRALARIRRGGITDNEETEYQNLIAQQRNLQNRRTSTRGSIGDNLRERFEAQAESIQTRLGQAIRGPVRAVQNLEFRNRINEIFGRTGDRDSVTGAMIANLESQRKFYINSIKEAKRTGNTELVDQLTDSLQELDGQIADLTAQRLNDAIDLVNTTAENRTRFADFRTRMAEATGTVGLDRFIPGLGGSRRTAFQERAGIMEDQLSGLQSLMTRAQAEGNITAINTLTEQILNLKVEIRQNSRELFLARIEEVNRNVELTSGQTSARGRIADLQRELGLISGEEAQTTQRNQLNILGEALQLQGAQLTNLLDEAKARQDEDQVNVLTQAILDNTIAQLENTKEVKELDGTLTNTQTFTTTAWTWLRDAIFNGSGGLLQQYQMPGTSAAAYAPNSRVMMDARGNRIIPSTRVAPTTGIGDRKFEININEAEPSDDPVYLANKMLFELDGNLGEHLSTNGGN